MIGQSNISNTKNLSTVMGKQAISLYFGATRKILLYTKNK